MLQTNTQPEGRSPFHAGEQAVQERLGVRDIEFWARQVVRDHLPEQHRTFYADLPFLVAAARDQEGRPWATVLTGPEGFVASPDPRHLSIAARPVPGDALERAFMPGADIGLLGIQLATRRRNRVNGRLATADTDDLVLEVGQSFGNCPQYIRERALWRVPDTPAGAPRRGVALTNEQRALIAKSDTFFIASGFRGDGEDAVFGMDASHRGGEPGFVEVLDERRLRFPDYAGNNHFNTIGNIQSDPRAGFLFIDFATGSLLQLTGRASIDWDSEAVARVPGARRLLTLDIEAIVELPSALPLRWEREAESVRSLRLVEKKAESADVTSFLFEARDGGPLPDFAAGQHLPIELHVPGHTSPGQRTYSLSGAPGGNRYRISVKRDGLASNFLHDHVEPGAIIDARRPGGDFTLPDGEAPLVLVSAGIGVTPMLSMLHALAAEGRERPVWFVHGVRDGRHHPFATEIRALAVQRANTHLHFAYSRPAPGDEGGRDYHSRGRVDGQLLDRLVRAEDAHYLICGPSGFMADVTQHLIDRGVAPQHIHTETFGPVG